MGLFNRTLGRIFETVTDSPLRTLYVFVCAAILCVLFQIFVLRKEAKKNSYHLSPKHFILVYIFLLYLSFVFQATGMGTLWFLGRYDTVIRISEIHLIPFSTFDTSMLFGSIMTDVLNIIMTIPFGFFLTLIWTEFRSIKKVALTGFVFSLFIELSQLLNRRATAIDDLIMNTLGAIIGYLIFKVIYKMISKTYKLQTTIKLSSPIIRNEAIIYLVCAFMGVFLFYNSEYILPFDTYSGEGIRIDVTDTDIEHFPTGTIVEISEDTIIIDKMELLKYGRRLSLGNTGGAETITLNDNTIIEIWRTDEMGTLDPLIVAASRESLSVYDVIEVQGEGEEGDIVAEKIIIWKYDR